MFLPTSAHLHPAWRAIATVRFLRQSFTEFKAETASAFRDLWKKEGEQDARLNTVERKHEGLEREHNVFSVLFQV